jgi:hypothetical protein
MSPGRFLLTVKTALDAFRFLVRWNVPSDGEEEYDG